jgi:hypothetical protein
MELLYEAKNLEISYDPVHRFIYCNWIGFQSKEMITRSGAIILDLFREKGCSKLLNDNTEVTGPWQEAAEWTSNVWFPAMISAGLKHFAWIFSPNLFAELSAKKAMPVFDVVKSFDSYYEARGWLIRQSV